MFYTNGSSGVRCISHPFFIAFLHNWSFFLEKWVDINTTTLEDILLFLVL